ncbi:SRPBCC family protein [Paenibacillus sp. sgz5001063]|uniref:SRPBCC family protein n=1 Tax=Paenibacillus sp. sgz5001063 TaxID=3242474 RepID=UPI0036D398E9
METGKPVTVTVDTVVNAPIEKVWTYWTEPKHITQWNNASEDWHTPYAENDLKAGGKFLSRMEAKDGSFGFDFTGVYDQVNLNESISYTIADGRKVVINFSHQDHNTKIITVFDAEDSNPAEMQRAGWQAILDNFKKYVETSPEE